MNYSGWMLDGTYKVNLSRNTVIHLSLDDKTALCGRELSGRLSRYECIGEFSKADVADGFAVRCSAGMYIHYYRYCSNCRKKARLLPPEEREK